MSKKINIFIGGSTNSDISANYNRLAINLGKKIKTRDYSIIFDGCFGLPFLSFLELADEYDRVSIFTTRYYTDVFNPFYKHKRFDKQSQFTFSITQESDAMIFMKGGIGTAIEVLHAIDSKKNKEHDHPIVIFNLNNEWDDLVNLLKTYNCDDLYYVTDNVIDGLNYIESELFKDDSYFYKVWLNFCDRKEPIIEKENLKHIYIKMR